MGIISWLVEEMVDLFTAEPPQAVADFADPAEVAIGSDFVDPLTSRGEQTLNSDPVLRGVNDQLRVAHEIYRQVAGTTDVPSGLESTQQFIGNVADASPDQLASMAGQLDAMNAADSIESSVAESQARLADRNASHELTIAADHTMIDAESVIEGTRRDLGRSG